MFNKNIFLVFLVIFVGEITSNSVFASRAKIKYTRKFSPEVTVIAELPVIDSNVIAVLANPIFKGIKSNSLNFLAFPIPGVVNERVELNDLNTFRFNNVPYNSLQYSLSEQQVQIESYLQRQINFDLVVFTNTNSQFFNSNLPVTKVSSKSELNNCIYSILKRNKKNKVNRKLIILVQTNYIPPKGPVKVNATVVKVNKKVEPFAFYEKFDSTYTLYGLVDYKFPDGKGHVLDGFWGIPLNTDCEIGSTLKIEIYDDENLRNLHKNGSRIATIIPVPNWVGESDNVKILKFDLDVTAENPEKPGLRHAAGNFIDHDDYYIKITSNNKDLLLNQEIEPIKVHFSLCAY